MTAEEIRDLYVETLASADYMRSFGADGYRWETTTERVREGARREASLHVDALAAAGLLPSSLEGRFIGRGMLRRTRLVTDWKEPEQ